MEEHEESLPQYDSLYRQKPLFSKPTPLTIDSDLIYATEPPSSAEYHLSSPLSTIGSTIYVQRSEVSEDQDFRDENIYEISQSTNSKDKDRFTIVGQKEKTISGTLKRSLAITGHRWSFRDGTGRELLAYASKTWRNDKGQLMAVEDVVGRRRRKGSVPVSSGESDDSRPVLQIAPTVGRMVVDLVVTVWVAKCWYAQSEG